MKVLRIVPFPPEFLGGVELYSKNLSIYLAKNMKITCDILTSNIMKRNVKFEFLNDFVKLIYCNCYYYLWNKNPVINIIPFLIKNYKKYDIIHTHGYYYFSTMQAAIVRKIKDVPLILHIHGGIQTSCNSISNHSENFQLFFKEKIFDPSFGSFTINSADAIISVAKKDLLILRQKYNIDKKNSYYIPNGVDTEKFKKRGNFEKKYLTFIGRLTTIKGFDIFIKMIKELYKRDKNLKFLIVGDGILRDLVLNAKKNLPIIYYKKYPYEKTQDIYNNSKLLLITSRFEGVPNTIYESLACETPVVSSNVGGISGIITHNYNGLLYDFKNYKLVIDSILDLIHDNKKLNDFGKRGRELMEKNHSWDNITKRIYNIYKRFY